MNYNQALAKCITDGVKIRGKFYKTGAYLYWNEIEGQLFAHQTGMDDYRYGAIKEVLNEIDFEIYEEPKPEKQIEKCESCISKRIKYISDGMFGRPICESIENNFCPECGHKIEEIINESQRSIR